MFTAYIAVTIVVAAVDMWAAVIDVARPKWLLLNMSEVGVRESQLPPLAALKAAGAAGLLVGIAVPALGVAAAIGLVLYFILAVGTVIRAPAYHQIPYPTAFLAVNVAALVLLLAAW